MGKFKHAFIEKVYRLYIPEDSPMFEKMLTEMKESIFYQQGLRDGLKTRQQLKTMQGNTGNEAK